MKYKLLLLLAVLSAFASADITSCSIRSASSGLTLAALQGDSFISTITAADVPDGSYSFEIRFLTEPPASASSSMPAAEAFKLGSIQTVKKAISLDNVRSGPTKLPPGEYYAYCIMTGRSIFFDYAGKMRIVSKDAAGETVDGIAAISWFHVNDNALSVIVDRGEPIAFRVELNAPAWREKTPEFYAEQVSVYYELLDASGKLAYITPVARAYWTDGTGHASFDASPEDLRKIPSGFYKAVAVAFNRFTGEIYARRYNRPEYAPEPRTGTVLITDWKATAPKDSATSGSLLTPAEFRKQRESQFAASVLGDAQSHALAAQAASDVTRLYYSSSHRGILVDKLADSIAVLQDTGLSKYKTLATGFDTLLTCFDGGMTVEESCSYPFKCVERYSDTRPQDAANDLQFTTMSAVPEYTNRPAAVRTACKDPEIKVLIDLADNGVYYTDYEVATAYYAAARWEEGNDWQAAFNLFSRLHSRFSSSSDSRARGLATDALRESDSILATRLNSGFTQQCLLGALDCIKGFATVENVVIMGANSLVKESGGAITIIASSAAQSIYFTYQGAKGLSSISHSNSVGYKEACNAACNAGVISMLGTHAVTSVSELKSAVQQLKIKQTTVPMENGMRLDITVEREAQAGRDLQDALKRASKKSWFDRILSGKFIDARKSRLTAALTEARKFSDLMPARLDSFDFKTASLFGRIKATLAASGDKYSASVPIERDFFELRLQLERERALAGEYSQRLKESGTGTPEENGYINSLYAYSGQLGDSIARLDTAYAGWHSAGVPGASLELSSVKTAVAELDEATTQLQALKARLGDKLAGYQATDAEAARLAGQAIGLEGTVASGEAPYDQSHKAAELRAQSEKLAGTLPADYAEYKALVASLKDKSASLNPMAAAQVGVQLNAFIVNLNPNVIGIIHQLAVHNSNADLAAAQQFLQGIDAIKIVYGGDLAAQPSVAAMLDAARTKVADAISAAQAAKNAPYTNPATPAKNVPVPSTTAEFVSMRAATSQIFGAFDAGRTLVESGVPSGVTPDVKIFTATEGYTTDTGFAVLPGERFLVKPLYAASGRAATLDSFVNARVSQVVLARLGFNVPESTYVVRDGTPYEVTRFIEGSSQLSRANLPEADPVRDARLLIASTILGNYDARDANILVADGKLYVIDLSGTLSTRAAGGVRDNFPPELTLDDVAQMPRPPDRNVLFDGVRGDKAALAIAALEMDASIPQVNGWLDADPEFARLTHDSYSAANLLQSRASSLRKALVADYGLDNLREVVREAQSATVSRTLVTSTGGYSPFRGSEFEVLGRSLPKDEALQELAAKATAEAPLLDAYQPFFQARRYIAPLPGEDAALVSRLLTQLGADPAKPSTLALDGADRPLADFALAVDYGHWAAFEPLLRNFAQRLGERGGVTGAERAYLEKLAEASFSPEATGTAKTAPLHPEVVSGLFQSARNIMPRLQGTVELSELLAEDLRSAGAKEVKVVHLPRDGVLFYFYQVYQDAAAGRDSSGTRMAMLSGSMLSNIEYQVERPSTGVSVMKTRLETDAAARLNARMSREGIKREVGDVEYNRELSLEYQNVVAEEIIKNPAFRQFSNDYIAYLIKEGIVTGEPGEAFVFVDTGYGTYPTFLQALIPLYYPQDRAIGMVTSGHNYLPAADRGGIGKPRDVGWSGWGDVEHFGDYSVGFRNDAQFKLPDAAYTATPENLAPLSPYSTPANLPDMVSVLLEVAQRSKQEQPALAVAVNGG